MTFRKLLILSALLASLSAEIQAQYKFTFSGYAENLPATELSNQNLAYYYNSDKTQFLDLTRVRLRPSLSLWKNARIEGEYEADGLYYSSANVLSITKGGKTNRQLFDLSWTPVNNKNYTLRHFIDRLYFRQDLNKLSVTVGRQRIAWGTGRIWNPTDLFNSINPASYYKEEKDGADAISLKESFGNFTDLNVVYNPQQEIKNSNYGFRFRTNYSGYDYSVMGGYFDNRIVGGADFAGNLFNAGVRGEGIISVNKNTPKDHFAKFILGIDNQFSSKLYGLIEYHYNGEGKADKSEYELNRLAAGEILNLGRNYICVSPAYQINPLLNFTLLNITNLNDGSGFVNLIVDFSAKSNLNIDLGSQITFGAEKTEYWYYPVSVYSIVKYFF